MVEGLDLKDKPEEIRRHIGIVTHQTLLYGNLTAYENLEFYSRMYDVPDRKHRIEEVVAMVGMTSRLYDRVGNFSRGMQQRISIARCLLHKPSIILLDEPETGLDPHATSMLWEALREEGEEKRTLIITSHSLERGLELGERLLILARGEIAYEGLREGMELAALKEVYEQAAEASV